MSSSAEANSGMAGYIKKNGIDPQESAILGIIRCQVKEGKNENRDYSNRAGPGQYR